jgi:hypothetical protein
MTTDSPSSENNEPTTVKRFILGPGQLIIFSLIVFLVLVVGAIPGWTWDQRWTVGSVCGLVSSCFAYYLVLDRTGYAFIFGVVSTLLICDLTIARQWTLRYPVVSLCEGILVAAILVRADLERVPGLQRHNKHRLDRVFYRLLRVDEPEPAELAHDPDGDKAIRILHYVDYPQLVGFIVTLGFFLYCSWSFGERIAADFAAGAFSFQLISAAIALTFIQWDIDSHE